MKNNNLNDLYPLLTTFTTSQYSNMPEIAQKKLGMSYSRKKTAWRNLMGREVVTIALLVTMLLIVLMLVL